MVYLIVMGVCGCGKTTIGRKLATELKLPFNDADDFHSPANKKQMSQGIALTDEDRVPWLISIYEHIESALKSGGQGVVACSALKRKYRKLLVTGSTTKDDTKDSIGNDIIFVYLKASPLVIKERMSIRKDHFMPTSLLDSQIATLEEPDKEENHLVVNVDNSVDDIIKEIVNRLHIY